MTALGRRPFVRACHRNWIDPHCVSPSLGRHVRWRSG